MLNAAEARDGIKSYERSGGTIFTKRRSWVLGIGAFVALAVTIVACGGDAPPEAPTTTKLTTEVLEPTPTVDQSIDLSGLAIAMSRTGCFGSCPIYTLTVASDGKVEYEGVRFVATVGTETSTITQEQTRQLIARFEEIGFTDLEDISACNPDAPSTIMSLSRGSGQEKTVTRCDFGNELEELGRLGDLIDEVTNSRQWVGLPEKVIVMSGGFYPAADEESCERLPCTDYTLTIYRDGRVEYEGFQNVNVIGTRSGEISEADVLDLVDRYLESGFFDLPPDFHCQVTDVGATTTAVFLRTRVNTIERCRIDVPDGRLEPVRQMEIAIAELVGLERWVGEVATP